MITFGSPLTPTSIISRVFSRGKVAREAFRTAGSCVIAALAAAAVLFTAQLSTRQAAAAAADGPRAPSVTSLVALHPVPTQRLGHELRSSMRWPPSMDVPLLAPARLELAEPIDVRVTIVGTIEQSDTSVAARGYDATAPPALS